MSKLKFKLRKPIIVEFILIELYDNEPVLKYVETDHVEHAVTLEEGWRFAFAYNKRHNKIFL